MIEFSGVDRDSLWRACKSIASSRSLKACLVGSNPAQAFFYAGEDVDSGEYDGTDYPTKTEIEAIIDSCGNEIKLEELRRKRDSLLAATDWWAFSDTPEMTQEQIDYRQALRDITNTYSSVDDVVWPTKPA